MNTNKKEILNKIALLLAGTVGVTTMTGCNRNEKENEKIESEVEITSETIDEIIETVIEETKNSETSQTQSTKSTTKTTTTTESTQSTTTPYETTSLTTVQSTTTPLTTTETATTVQTTMTETTSMTTIETMPIAQAENRYIVGSTYQSKGEYLYSIIKTIYGNTTEDMIEKIKEMNKIEENFVEKGKVLLLPSTTIYYKAYKGQTIESISLETEVMYDRICELNNIDIEKYQEPLDNEMKLLISVIDVNENSYDTLYSDRKAYVYQGNVIIAKQIEFASGYAGASNHALILTDSKTDEYHNFVYYLVFNDGSYTSQLVATYADKIDTINGAPVIYSNSNTQKYVNADTYLYNGEEVFSPIMKDLTLAGCEKQKELTK